MKRELALLAGTMICCAGIASAETLSADGLTFGCTDKTLFRELLIIGHDNSNAFLSKLIDQTDRGNCHAFGKGDRVVVDERDDGPKSIKAILIRVHAMGEVGSYWTAAQFFSPSH